MTAKKIFIESTERSPEKLQNKQQSEKTGSTAKDLKQNEKPG